MYLNIFLRNEHLYDNNRDNKIKMTLGRTAVQT